MQKDCIVINSFTITETFCDAFRRELDDGNVKRHNTAKSATFCFSFGVVTFGSVVTLKRVTNCKSIIGRRWVVKQNYVPSKFSYTWVSIGLLSARQNS